MNSIKAAGRQTLRDHGSKQIQGNIAHRSQTIELRLKIHINGAACRDQSYGHEPSDPYLQKRDNSKLNSIMKSSYAKTSLSIDKFKRPYAETSLMIKIILTSVSLNVLMPNNF